jgi:hypothetical protein
MKYVERVLQADENIVFFEPSLLGLFIGPKIILIVAAIIALISAHGTDAL